MRYFGKSDNEALALAAMENKAKSLGVDGVAVVLIEKYGDPSLSPIIAYFGGAHDAKRNFVGIALSMLAEMIVTEKDSGRAPHPEGESGQRGGIFRRDSTTISKLTTNFHLYTAFAGGITEDQNAEVATAGMNAMLGI